MTLPRTHVIHCVRDSGPARRRVLEGIAESHGAPDGAAVLDRLLARGRLVMLGRGKGARYGLPGMKLFKKRKTRRSKR